MISQWKCSWGKTLRKWLWTKPNTSLSNFVSLDWEVAATPKLSRGGFRVGHMTWLFRDGKFAKSDTHTHTHTFSPPPRCSMVWSLQAVGSHLGWTWWALQGWWGGSHCKDGLYKERGWAGVRPGVPNSQVLPQGIHWGAYVCMMSLLVCHK